MRGPFWFQGTLLGKLATFLEIGYSFGNWLLFLEIGYFFGDWLLSWRLVTLFEIGYFFWKLVTFFGNWLLFLEILDGLTLSCRSKQQVTDLIRCCLLHSRKDASVYIHSESRGTVT